MFQYVRREGCLAWRSQLPSRKSLISYWLTTSSRSLSIPNGYQILCSWRSRTKKWRTIDFFNLNDACPKDCFPLPRIDQLVDATTRHELLSFMDAHSEYNQITRHVPDQESTSFITDHGLYYYRVMPFGLKNAGAIYQCLVNTMFAEHIGKTVEVYVDDMLYKSKKFAGHVPDLREIFGVLRRYGMKLNPLKCAFGVSFEKFFGFMVNAWGIKVNPEQIEAQKMVKPPST